MAPVTAKLKRIMKYTSRTASESVRSYVISVFEVHGSILRGVNGNVSSTIMKFFIFKHSLCVVISSPYMAFKLYVSAS